MTKLEILDYLNSHYTYLKEKYGVETIGMFGSYARDKAKEDSDIDIFVKMKPKLLDMVAIKQMIEEDLQKKVDIVRLRDKMNPYLKKRILEDGICAVR